MSRFRKISLGSTDKVEKTPDNARKAPETPEFDKWAQYASDQAVPSGSPFHLDPLMFKSDPTQGRNPDNECQCDTCLIFQTSMGQAVLQWASSLTRSVREAIDLGADPNLNLNMTLMGPTPKAFAASSSAHIDQQQYATINMVLKEATDRASILTEPVPDWSHLREAYAMEPAIIALLDWLDRRLSR